MTTIAWRGNEFVADSQLTWSKHFPTASEAKIRQLPSGILIGGAGSMTDTRKAELFFSDPDWINVSLDKLPKLKSYEGLFWDGHEMYWVDEELVPCVVVDDFSAIGSGWELAMAAMDHGKSASEAVLYAATRDIFTNDKLQVIYLDQTKTKTKTSTRGKKQARTE